MAGRDRGAQLPRQHDGFPELNALDSAGYATAVLPGAAGLVTSPASLPAAYSRQLDGGSGASLFATGPATSGIVASNRRIAAKSATYGWRLADVERSASLPVYALRAENGGAVVIFVTYNQFSWTAQSAAAQLPKTNTQAANQSEEPGPAGGGLISTPFYSGGLLSITKN